MAFSSEYKLTKLISQIGCTFYNLTLLIQKLSAQIPKAFNQYGTAQKTTWIFKSEITTYWEGKILNLTTDNLIFIILDSLYAKL